MDDARIIELYFARDEAAIEATRRSYGGRLRGVARRVLTDEQDAEECENDTYLKTWNSIPPACPQHLLAYLVKICRNTALDALDRRHAGKRSAQIVELTEEMQACIPDVACDWTVEHERMGELLSSFLRAQSADNRNVFIRRYVLAEPVAEVAKALGFSESKVKSSLSRTRTRLKRFLEEEGVGYAGL